MTAEILKGLVAMNLAGGGAILLLLAIGGPLRRAFGARLAYRAWALAPLAAAASLLPARARDSAPIAPAPVREAAEATVVMVFETASADWTGGAVLAWAVVALILIGLTVWTQKRTLGLIGRLTLEGPLVRSSNPAVGPAILGVIRPRIMVPADFERRFDADQQAVILAHEEAHLASGDARINALVELARCLFWFNPLVHLAARRIRIDQELACDAAVIARFPRSRRAYAEALLKTQTAAAPLPLGCYWPGRSPARLKERLTMLTLKSPGRARSLCGAACLTLLAIGTGYAAWAAAPAAADAPVAALPGPVLVEETVLAPAPAQQSLTNSRAAPPADTAATIDNEDKADVLHTFSLKIAPPPEGQAPAPGRVFVLRREGEGPLPDKAALDALLSGGRRIECSKTGDGPLVCSRDGAPLEGEALEQLRAALPVMRGDARLKISGDVGPHPEGADEVRRMLILQGRRTAE